MFLDLSSLSLSPDLAPTSADGATGGAASYSLAAPALSLDPEPFALTPDAPTQPRGSERFREATEGALELAEWTRGEIARLGPSDVHAFATFHYVRLDSGGDAYYVSTALGLGPAETAIRDALLCRLYGRPWPHTPLGGTR
jgi:hypothetical protein